MKNTPLKQVKSYTNNNHNHANLNVIDLTKDYFIIPLTIK